MKAVDADSSSGRKENPRSNRRALEFDVSMVKSVIRLGFIFQCFFKVRSLH